MAEKPSDETPRGWLRALYDRLTGARAAASPAATPPPEGPPVRIGHYAIAHKLGQGGMGVVYAARDERLERTVAVKTMALASDEIARKRFWREARVAASVNHPNVCQLYEIGEHAGELFLAMELLEGEALSARLQRGPFSLAEAVPIGLGILAALSALHARGIVHRDLKPSNVFLTQHGVKVLDFGLARFNDPGLAPSPGPATELTRAGIVMGTPRYMAPEQVTGEPIGAHSDLFAAGAILFEMLAGRPAFGGRNAVEILHATLHEQPPALTGSPAVAAADRLIHRALAKRPAERPASADAMAEELRAVIGLEGDNAPALARALTRLVVLPLRILRPDPETDFLAFSLADAIASSLSRIGSLVVRSSAIASRLASDAPDLKAIASEADVDRVVLGTLLRSGDELRATAQLVEAPSGTLLGSHTVQSSLGGLFQLQDDIARRVVEALALPLGQGADFPTPLAPANTRAYGLYLRANELGRSFDKLAEARGLYKAALDLDPGFAPAWAQLGRCHRVIGKYIDQAADGGEGEAALRRALELDPRLSLAHKLYANLEADTGHALAAMVRLLGEASRHGNDPELFAGLVHALRYCGLYEQSVAAHEEARRLDPNVRTSFEQTLLMTCDIERLLTVAPSAVGGDAVIRIIGLGMAGRRHEARQLLLPLREAPPLPAFRSWTDVLLAWLERRPADMADSIAAISGLKIMDDPEAIFQEGWMLCDVGEHERGLGQLRRAVAKGYSVAPTLALSRSFDALRGERAFQQLLAEAKSARQHALATFHEHGGERLLGRDAAA